MPWGRHPSEDETLSVAEAVEWFRALWWGEYRDVSELVEEQVEHPSDAVRWVIRPSGQGCEPFFLQADTWHLEEGADPLDEHSEPLLRCGSDGWDVQVGDLDVLRGYLVAQAEGRLVVDVRGARTTIRVLDLRGRTVDSVSLHAVDLTLSRRRPRHGTRTWTCGRPWAGDQNRV